MYEAKDKVVLVTGGSAGIGAGVVRAFLDQGAKHVAILDLDIKGKELAEELAAKHGEEKVKFYKCDVTKNDLNEAFEDILKNFGYIDVVINNAGIMNDGPNAYERQIAVNVTAVFTSSLKAYNLMRKDRGGKGGTIVNISSIIALFPSRFLPVYCGTKSAVLQFSYVLGMEPNYLRSGVRVVTMCFGCTDTSLLSTAKMEPFDDVYDDLLLPGLKTLPWQKIESAVNGLMEAYKVGASASTWLVSADRPAEDITANIKKAHQVMSQGIFD